MKVERIQLPPSSTFGSPDVKDSGNRVNGAGDSTQHRRNGQQMRQDTDQDESASKDQTSSNAQSATEIASNPAVSPHVLDITA
jgi:hypothetical protein